MNLKIIFFLLFLCAKGLLVFGHQGMWIPSLLKVIEGEMLTAKILRNQSICEWILRGGF